MISDTTSLSLVTSVQHAFLVLSLQLSSPHHPQSSCVIPLCPSPHLLPLTPVPLGPTLVLLSSVGENLTELHFNDTMQSWFLILTEFSQWPSHSLSLSCSLLSFSTVAGSDPHYYYKSPKLINLFLPQITLLTYYTEGEKKTTQVNTSGRNSLTSRPHSPQSYSLWPPFFPPYLVVTMEDVAHPSPLPYMFWSPL